MCIHHIIHDVNPSFQGYNLQKDRERKRENRSQPKKLVNISLLVLITPQHPSASIRTRCTSFPSWLRMAAMCDQRTGLRFPQKSGTIQTIKQYNKTPETLVLSQCKEILRKVYKQSRGLPAQRAGLLP